MKPFHYVIIGNGIAANRAAEVLRQNDPESKISLISREFFVFYFRHKLPAFVTGGISEDALPVHQPQHYKERNIRLRLGQTVKKVDLKEKVLYLKHMEKVHYDRLLICSGGVPHIPEVYYEYRPHLTTLKRLATARELRKKLPLIQRITILGGDLISLRLAAALIQSGREVTFILDDYAFWPVDAAPEIRSNLEASLKKMGANVISEDPMARVEQISDDEPHGYKVVTRSGKEVYSQMVGAFFGFKPDVDFLIRSGLDIDRGILVDDKLQTAHEDVFAAGDCAQVYAPQLKNYWVSVGWKNALLLGEVAAHNMTGQGDHAEAPPMELFELSDVQIKTPWWHAL